MDKEAATTNEKPSAAKIWITAVRPWSFTASALAAILGLAVSIGLGNPVKWGLFALTLIGVVLFQAATNLLNDCFDHKRGLDAHVFPMSGAVVRGWITEKQAMAAATVCLVAGSACGFALMFLTGKVVLILGAAGMVLALGYTTGRFCFKYNGLGDLAVFLAFGILPVFGAFWVQTETFSWQPIFWSVPLCSFTVAILHANNWRDLDRDKSEKCITLSVLLGHKLSALYYRTLVLAPYAVVAVAIIGARVCPVMPDVSLWTALTALSLPLAIKAAKAGEGDEVFVMLDGKSAQLHTAFGVLLVAGLILGRFLPG